MLQFIPVIGSLIKTAGSVFTNWQERKTIKAEGKVKLEQAKVDGAVKRIQTQLEGDLTYDQSAVEGMRYSWKDEWFVVLLSMPFIACFIPPLTEYVKEGFIVLRDSTPEWYQYCFVGAIVASFGLKTWMNRRLK
jgi:hypothetical protein